VRQFKLHILLTLIISSIFILGHTLTRRRIKAIRKVAKSGWTKTKVDIARRIENFEDVAKDAKKASGKVAEKINKIKADREKKLKELRDKKTNGEISWDEYSKEKREAIEDHDEDMEELYYDEETRATEPVVRFKFSQKIKRVTLLSLMGKDEAATKELAGLDALIGEIKNDVEDALGEWFDERPSGEEVEKKLTLLNKQFLTGLATNYKDVPKDKMDQLEKVKNDHLKELKDLEATKKSGLFSFFNYSIKKWKINKNYKKQYEELGEEVKPLLFSLEWARQNGEIMQVWYKKDKKKYGKTLKGIKELVQEVNKKV